MRNVINTFQMLLLFKADGSKNTNSIPFEAIDMDDPGFHFIDKKYCGRSPEGVWTSTRKGEEILLLKTV